MQAPSAQDSIDAVRIRILGLLRRRGTRKRKNWGRRGIPWPQRTRKPLSDQDKSDERGQGGVSWAAAVCCERTPPTAVVGRARKEAGHGQWPAHFMQLAGASALSSNDSRGGPLKSTCRSRHIASISRQDQFCGFSLGLIRRMLPKVNRRELLLALACWSAHSVPAELSALFFVSPV